MRTGLLIASLFFMANAAIACGVCLSVQGNPLALPHPRAIEVAVATRNALDRGLLRSASPVNSARHTKWMCPCRCSET